MQDPRSSLPLVSIVVPTHNRASTLHVALTSFAKAAARVPSTAEIVVVNDGSTDDTAIILAAAYAEGLVHRVVTHPVSRGPAAARNTGWRSANSVFIAFTDDDCEVAPDWLLRLLDTLSDSAPQVAGVGGRVKAARPGMIADYMTFHRILEPPASLSYLVTANAMFRREALEEVGGFDEAVLAPGGEDPGLCMNLRDLGYHFAFEERAVVFHHYRQSFMNYIRTFYRYGRGCRLVMDS